MNNNVMTDIVNMYLILNYAYVENMLCNFISQAVSAIPYS